MSDFWSDNWLLMLRLDGYGFHTRAQQEAVGAAVLAGELSDEEAKALAVPDVLARIGFKESQES